MEEELFEIEQMPLSFARNSGQYLQDRRSKKLNYTRDLKQAEYFRQKRRPFLEALENLVYGAREHMNTIQFVWKSLMSYFVKLS